VIYDSRRLFIDEHPIFYDEYNWGLRDDFYWDLGITLSGRYVSGLENTIVSVKSPAFFHSSKK